MPNDNKREVPQWNLQDATDRTTHKESLGTGRIYGELWLTWSAFVDSQRPCYHAESKTGNISYLGTEMLRTCREKTEEERTEAERCHRKRQEGYSHIPNNSIGRNNNIGRNNFVIKI